MKDLLKKGISLGLGLAIISKEQIEKVVDELVTKGEVSANESKELVNELLRKGEEEQQELNKKLKEQVQKILAEMNIATKDEIKSLQERIEKLERI